MKLKVSGNINEYYVQTLCMIFFPGEKFSEAQVEDAQANGIAVPELSLELVFRKCVSRSTFRCRNGLTVGKFSFKPC